jgi:hypothetical protein
VAGHLDSTASLAPQKPPGTVIEPFSPMMRSVLSAVVSKAQTNCDTTPRES